MLPFNRSLVVALSLIPFLSVDAAVVNTSATDASATASVSDDLLQTSLLSTTWQANNNINNGTTGAFSVDDGVNPASVTGVGSKDFVLDLTANPEGYDISQINAYSGWNDNRAGQAYTVYFSVVGDPAFVQITPSQVSVAATGQSLVTSVFDDGGALLGSGVDVIRFDVGTNGNGNVWREIDVMGTPTQGAITGFSASPEVIASGDPVELSWQFDSGVLTASIDQGVGDVLPMTVNGIGSVTLDPGPITTTTYELSTTYASGSSTESVTVGINNNPIIQSFDVGQAVVAPGTDVSLSWEISNYEELYLNGTLLEDVGSSIDVSPLISTTYSLQAVNTHGSDSAELTIEVLDAGIPSGVSARFIEVIQNDSTSNARLHLSEIEVFSFGTTPDNAHADGTSSNDLVQNGSPSTVTPPTTTDLGHGAPSAVFDGDLESGEAVWSTNDNLGYASVYMLDLGASATIDTVRLFGRADNVATRGLENFSVNVYADNGSGAPGELLNAVSHPGTAIHGGAGYAEFSLALLRPGVTSFEVDKSTIAAGEAITFSWEVSTTSTEIYIDNGVGDLSFVTDGQGTGSTTISGPAMDTTYILVAERVNGTSAASVTVQVTDQPIIREFASDQGNVAPETAVELSWEAINATTLTLNGIDVDGLSQTTVTPESSTTYELLATNVNGTVSEEIFVRVVLPGEPIISEFLASNASGHLDEDGEHSDWIEIYNPTDASVNLAGYHLTDDPLLLTKWTFPSVSLAAGEYLVVFASANDRSVAGSELHTNFSLSDSGEYLALVKPDGSTIVLDFLPEYPEQETDFSYGYDAVALKDGYFIEPTPGAANNTSAGGFVADTAFSIDRGFYDAPISVEITCKTVDAEIRYTTDGSIPTAVTGQSYANPISIDETTVLRAAAFKNGYIQSNVDTQTYIFAADVVTQSNMGTSITQDPTYGPQMEAALKAVPTISLVFDGDIERTEKATSVELINFEAGNMQVDAGMERFGNYNTDFSKRSMRINFRKLYGPSKLEFPVYEGHDYVTPPAAQFDGLELRSGNHDMSQRGAYLSNRFVDDTMLDMGDISPHGRFVHVYINGLYWGQYHLRERWNASMLSEYFGGSEDDYEAVNANDHFEADLVVYDGSGQYWAEAEALAVGPDPFENIRSHIDIPNLIDFMLVYVSGANESEFRSGGAVPLGVPFKFYMKDADGFLRSQNRNVLDDGPLDLMSILRSESDPDYEILVADRIHKHYFNDGAFTPAENIARLQDRMDEIQLSFLAESARWGQRTPASWQSYQDNLINNHFPDWTDTLIARFIAAGMYPTLEAPVFNQHGGDVAAGFQLVMTAPESTIYYTVDGSDPRESALPTEPSTPVTIVSEAAAKSVYIPTTTTDGFTDGFGVDWNEVNYNDNGWTSGIGGVGYETSSGYEAYFDIDVESAMSDQYSSCLVRIPFDLSAGTLDGMAGAELQVRYDDGYVAYLNGVEIARRNFNGTPNGLSSASSGHNDGAAVVLETVDISEHFNLLNDGGSNVLAIHGLNVSNGSSDFLISARMVVSNVASSGDSGAISDAAIAYTGSVQIDASTLVRARVYNGVRWSALNEAFFAVNAYEPSPGDLIVSELHYNGYESGDPEYIEFYNNAAHHLILDRLQIVDGVSFLFPEFLDLAVGERIVVVSDLGEFDSRYRDVDSPWYHAGIRVAGEYSGSLSGNGERITLNDAYGVELLDFEYNDSGSWPGRPDGKGSALELSTPASAAATQPELDDYLDDGDHWQATSEFHGSPGWEGLGPDNRVVFNEVLPHTDLPLKDSFELYNTTGSDINISGWMVSDEASPYAKFQIGNGTIIGAYGLMTYDEDDFNDGDSLVDFALSSSLGDNLYLLETDASGNPIRFVDHVRFDPSKNAESFGRWPDGEGQLYPMVNRTLGQLNTHGGNTIRTGPVVVSEIHYHPLDSEQPIEFIEIFNAGDSSEDLENWRLRGEADFDFAAETLPAGGTLVITAFDPSAETTSLNQFLAKYSEVSAAQLRGPWSGGSGNRLDNAGAEIKLQRPDTLEVPIEGDPFYPMLVEDTVNYDDTTPWPEEADGTGASLERIETVVYGDLATNWQANAAPSPGRHNLHLFADYETWVTANDLGTGPRSLREGDFDFDGYPNLVEFALAQDPKDGKRAQPFEFGFNSLTVDDETAQYLTVDLQYRIDSGFTVEVLVSSDLENWVPLVDEYSASVDNGNQIQNVFYRDTDTTDAFQNRFIKVEVRED
ncbi:MAG: lamin tail domain-containing protein [Opitutaceae bacterium]